MREKKAGQGRDLTLNLPFLQGGSQWNKLILYGGGGGTDVLAISDSEAPVTLSVYLCMSDWAQEEGRRGKKSCKLLFYPEMSLMEACLLQNMTGEERKAQIILCQTMMQDSKLSYEPFTGKKTKYECGVGNRVFPSVSVMWWVGAICVVCKITK